MPGSKSDAFENDIADWIVGRTPSGGVTGLGAPSPVHQLALFTDTLTDADVVVGTGNTEVSGGSYARITLPGAYFGTAASGGVVSNDADISFTQASADWGSIMSWAIVEATSNAIIAYCDDPAAANGGTGIPVNDGDTAKFLSGQITVTET